MRIDLYRELNSLHLGLKIKHMKVDHICGKYSPQNRGGLDASDTDSVDLTPENHGPHQLNCKQTANDYKNAVYRIRDADAIFRIERKDGQKIAKTRNYSTQSMDNLPVIIAEVSVAPSGESFRNTFFFLRMFQTFYRRFYQNTTNHVMGRQTDRQTYLFDQMYK